MARGRLIVLEGAEGVGKTTQLRRLSAQLEARGIAHVTVREPGGTPLGEGIRELLLNSSVAHPGPRAETLLFIAARAQLVQDVVVPALDGGTTVIADRSFLSTYAYQIAGRGLPDEEVRAANRLATGGLIPDLALLLVLPVADALARTDRRGARDRIERSGDDFHERVAKAYARFTDPDWQGRYPECGPIVRLDAGGSEEAVAARIEEALAAKWPETFGS